MTIWVPKIFPPLARSSARSFLAAMTSSTVAVANHLKRVNELILLSLKRISPVLKGTFSWERLPIMINSEPLGRNVKI